jgi:predicted amidophosphoribosyltransferase
MNGPQIVCAGCGDPTGLYAPLCDQCARNYVELVDEVPHCLLCEQGNARDKTGLLHLTASGGYMAKCENPRPTSNTSSEGTT